MMGIDASGILVFTANMSTKGKHKINEAKCVAFYIDWYQDMQNYIEENLDIKQKEYQEHLYAQRTSNQ